MKDKILEEALKWYENQDENPNIEDFIDIVIHKTTDSLFDKVIEELKGEFSNGNLKHNFAISLFRVYYRLFFFITFKHLRFSAISK